MSRSKLVFACGFALALATGAAYAQNNTANQKEVKQGQTLIKQGAVDEKSKNKQTEALGKQDIAKGKADVLAGEKGEKGLKTGAVDKSWNLEKNTPGIATVGAGAGKKSP
jgi:hypothetical protein